jgi:hypothetical protein
MITAPLVFVWANSPNHPEVEQSDHYGRRLVACSQQAWRITYSLRHTRAILCNAGSHRRSLKRLQEATIQEKNVIYSIEGSVKALIMYVVN